MTRATRAAVLVVTLILSALLAVVATAPRGEVESADPPSTTTPHVFAQSMAQAILTTTTTTTTAPPPPPTTAPPRRVQAASVAPSGDRFDALAQCESGGDPRAVSASGTYRGAFQFDLQTWASTGRTGDPIDYSYGEQKAAAIDLQAARGWSPWPTCARRLGYL